MPLVYFTWNPGVRNRCSTFKSSLFGSHVCLPRPDSKVHKRVLSRYSLSSQQFLWVSHSTFLRSYFPDFNEGFCFFDSSFYLWYIVKRAKPCLDYSATIHTIHLLFCWIFTGSFPFSFSWWILNSICIGITCVCGEFLCMKTEMKSIPLLSKSEV